MTHVVVLHLGRTAGLGEERRVAAWAAAFAAAEIESTAIPLLSLGRGLSAPSMIAAVAAGTAVPEVAAWDLARAVAALKAAEPDAVVCVTTRAYHPGLSLANIPIILDFVDRLSLSYRDRGTVARSTPRGLLFRGLALAHRRAERRLHGPVRVAAGWADAEALDAVWFPNLLPVAEPVDPAAADRDLLFFGNLAYEPNISAVERFGRLWPELQRRRPQTSVLVAGAGPVKRVVELADRNGWELLSGFDDIRQLAARARLAVAPLVHTAGIQNKVLEAASVALPQVISPEAAAGLDPAFPVTVAADDAAFVDAVVALLDDPTRRAAEGAAAAAHMAQRYTPEAWAPTVRELLSGRPAPERR